MEGFFCLGFVMLFIMLLDSFLVFGCYFGLLWMVGGVWIEFGLAIEFGGFDVGCLLVISVFCYVYYVFSYYFILYCGLLVCV